MKVITDYDNIVFGNSNYDNNYNYLRLCIRLQSITITPSLVHTTIANVHVQSSIKLVYTQTNW